MLRSLSSPSVFCSLVAASVLATSAYASPVVFSATGLTQNGSTLSGTVVIDTATGVVQSANLTMTGTFAFSVNTPHGFAGAPGNYFIAVDNGAPPPAVDIVVPVTNLIGYAGGSICLIGQCGGQASVAATAATSSGFTSGNLTATAPEPASLALVGAALGCLAMWRRRRNAA